MEQERPRFVAASVFAVRVVESVGYSLCSQQ